MRKRHRAAVLRSGVLTVVALMATGSAQTKGQLQIELLPGDAASCGSSGYGNAFLRDMVGDYFRHAHLDVMTGIDAVIAMGVADPDRLVLMGWSAGGHMTNKLITFTDRFKAASAGAGAANWISMYAQTDICTDRDLWFGGSPCSQSIEMFRALRSRGVTTHLYVAPREGHAWGELRHQLFKMNAELDWFEQHAMGRQHNWEPAPE